MTAHARTEGMALLATLLIAFLVTALGASALSMNSNQIRTQGNVQAAAIARQNAATGLDMALFQLERTFDEQGSLPSAGTFDLAAMASGNASVDYALDGYDTTAMDDGRVTIRVRGAGPRDASAVAVATLALDRSTGTGDGVFSGFAEGLVSGDTVTIRGAGSTFRLIDTAIHANQRIVASGNPSSPFRACTDRDDDGACDDASGNVDVPPITGVNGASCQIPAWNGGIACSNGTVTTTIDDPFLVNGTRITPDVEGLIARVLCEIDSGSADACLDGSAGTEAFQDATFETVANAGLCTRRHDRDLTVKKEKHLDDAGLYENQVVCVDGNLDLPKDAELENVTIIASGSITADRDTRLENVTVVSLDGAVDLGEKDVELEASRVFAAGDVTLGKNKGNPAEIERGSTIASGGTLAAYLEAEDDVTYTRTALIAEGNVTFGPSEASRLAIFAGGDVSTAQGASASEVLYANIVANGSITLRGSGTFELDGGLEVVNPYLPRQPTLGEGGGLRVTSLYFE